MFTGKMTGLPRIKRVLTLLFFLRSLALVGEMVLMFECLERAVGF
jgi:hypothetical protein